MDVIVIKIAKILPYVMEHFHEKNDHLLSEICISYLYELIKLREMVDTTTVNKFQPFLLEKMP